MDNIEWLKRELKEYPGSKTILGIGCEADKKLLLEVVKTFDGVGIVSPDVIIAQVIPQHYTDILGKCKSMMHDNSILFAQSYQSDMDIYINHAGLKLIKVFKEDVNFIYVIKK
jgi:hypothetical protein